jgi:ABC-type uncharacterized transport system auxiliary subunit
VKLHLDGNAMELPMKSLLIPLMLALLVTACGSVPPAPEDRYYRLSAVTDTGPGQGQALPDILAIGSVDSAAVYSERAVVYSESGQPNKLKHYNYHFWADPPPSLIRDHLAQYLRNSQAAPVVVVDKGEAEWKYLLVSRLRRFERVMNVIGSRVVVEMEFRLLQRGGRQPLLIQDYSAEVGVSGGSVNAAAEAFGEALGEIYQKLLADMRGHGG